MQSFSGAEREPEPEPEPEQEPEQEQEPEPEPAPEPQLERLDSDLSGAELRERQKARAEKPPLSLDGEWRIEGVMGTNSCSETIWLKQRSKDGQYSGQGTEDDGEIFQLADPKLVTYTERPCRFTCKQALDGSTPTQWEADVKEVDGNVMMENGKWSDADGEFGTFVGTLTSRRRTEPKRSQSGKQLLTMVSESPEKEEEEHETPDSATAALATNEQWSAPAPAPDPAPGPSPAPAPAEALLAPQLPPEDFSTGAKPELRHIAATRETALVAQLERNAASAKQRGDERLHAHYSTMLEQQRQSPPYDPGLDSG